MADNRKGEGRQQQAASGRSGQAAAGKPEGRQAASGQKQPMPEKKEQHKGQGGSDRGGSRQH